MGISHACKQQEDFVNYIDVVIYIRQRQVIISIVNVMLHAFICRNGVRRAEGEEVII